MPLKINPDISLTIWLITGDFFSLFFLVLLNLRCIFQHRRKCRAFENFLVWVVYAYMCSPIYFPVNCSQDWSLRDRVWSKWHILLCPGARASYYCLNLSLDCIYCSLLSLRVLVLKAECCSSNSCRAACFLLLLVEQVLEIESSDFHKAPQV